MGAMLSTSGVGSDHLASGSIGNQRRLPRSPFTTPAGAAVRLWELAKPVGQLPPRPARRGPPVPAGAGALGAVRAQLKKPVTGSPCTSSRGWLRWLYTNVAGLMPIEW